MLPLIALNDELQYWDGPFKVVFPLGPTPASFTARDQTTNTFAAAANLPLLGQFGLNEQRESAESSSLAAAAVARAGERGLREAVKTGFLRYFESKAAEEIGNASVAQLEEQRSIIEARLKAGAATNADVLRVAVAIANAKQQVLVARSQEMSTRSALLIAMGFDREQSDIELAEPSALEDTAALSVSEPEAQRLAIERRDEVQRSRYELESAVHARKAKRWGLLPQLDAEAAYVNVQGQAFAPENSGYAGLKVSWPIWEWGASWYAAEAAAKQAEAAEAAVEEAERDVRTDASNHVAQLEAAAAAVDVAQTAIASAEEAFRVTEALVKAGSGTTTDLLDAQAALTQARLNLVRARYERAIANVALERAVGAADH